MRLSLCLQGVRDKVNDAASKQWSDAQITYWINRKQESIYNELLQADPTYKQTKVSLSSSDATQVNTNIWRYVLPSWCHRINMLYETSASGQARKNPLTPISDDEFHRYGWCFDGDRSIELRGTGDAKDLTLWVSKPPAPLCKGTLQAVTTASVLAIDFVTAPPSDGDGNAYELVYDDDAYVNSIFEPTGAGFREVVRCSTSLFDNVSPTGFLLATIEPVLAGTPASQAFEMHVEVDGQYMEYLMLDVAMTLFQKTRNSEGIASLTPELRVERAKFINAIQPRQVQEPYRVRPEGSFDHGPYDDANRDWRW